MEKENGIKTLLDMGDRIDARLHWLDGIVGLMEQIDEDNGSVPQLENVGWLIRHLLDEIKQDSDSMFELAKQTYKKEEVVNR